MITFPIAAIEYRTVDVDACRVLAIAARSGAEHMLDRVEAEALGALHNPVSGLKELGSRLSARKWDVDTEGPLARPKPGSGQARDSEFEIQGKARRIGPRRGQGPRGGSG
ncbi:MAG: hypothetical protein KKA67_02600 [Spirochaetes bacterium]|nr:hypothetical protein [Spirochaetota bacterium]MBU1080174.1 hypothetical protein [Spirochaetota bacterium]